ncbi:MAG: ubiquinone biosynthesis regulatory protein kinase UbiB [Gammaproteobacteria bacterium]
MIRPGQVLRLLHINFVLMRHGLDEIILATHLFRPLRFLAFLTPWNLLGRKGSRGERIRLALEDLGPIFVKFGQLLSTRSDLLPPDIAIELSRLQDRVPPFDGKVATSKIESSLGAKVGELFASFSREPLASASIAQVHAATLNDGGEVVVKVVRPGIQKVIKRDVALLYTIAELAERYWPDGRRLHPVEVIREFERTIHDELDLGREAANAAQLRRNFEDSPILYVPQVYWDFTRRDVMVMERVHGIPVADTEALKDAGVNLQLLSERGVEIFFTQVFRDSFFHADMHPGNIFVDARNPADPRYIAIDFGIMGTLSPVDQHYLAENFLAFFNRDYRRVAELHIESAWVPKNTRVDEFESAIRTASEPIFGKPLKEISFGHFLLRLFQTARRFNMEVQPQLVLLQKTLLSIEGLGRRLYPDLDLWKTAKPFMERFMSEQVGIRAYAKSFKSEAPKWGGVIPELPGLAHQFLRQSTEGQLQVTQHSPDIKALSKQLRGIARGLYLTIVGSALIICAAILWGLDGYSPTMFGDLPIGTWVLGGIGIALLLAAIPDSE